MEGKVAMTTDSFVVDPIFFPGGDIGQLAVHGTVNDLVCCGAVPRFLSLALILEEGMPMEDLWKVVQSIGAAAEKAGVYVVTGDTKVVEKGKGDRIFINTTGIGELLPGVNIAPSGCREGDAVLINGPIGDHGIAILNARNQVLLESEVKSDTCALWNMMREVFRAVPGIHVLRDPTRGGVASALNEICAASNTGITLYEKEIPVSPGVRGASEILGLDPLYIANEGKMLVILPGKDADRALSVMRSFPEGRESRIIGRVTSSHPGLLQMETVIGTCRIVKMITGEQLPRIC
jgi:hydrogenase expression/formation protein HypE